MHSSPEHSLIEALDRCQHRPVAERNVEEMQPVDMAPEHDEA